MILIDMIMGSCWSGVMDSMIKWDEWEIIIIRYEMKRWYDWLKLEVKWMENEKGIIMNIITPFN